jgi:hypothetical protein
LLEHCCLPQFFGFPPTPILIGFIGHPIRVVESGMPGAEVPARRA